MQTIFTRYMFIVAILILWIGGISVRLVHLQVNQNEWLRERAQNQRRDLVKSKMLRGTIFDRSERALAMSVKVKSLYADPTEIEDLNETAGKLAKALKGSKKEILSLLKDGKEKNRRFVWIERKIDEDRVSEINEELEEKELRKFDLPRIAGLHWKEEQKRNYPYKSLAAHVIGFSNSDDIGQSGIEQSSEDVLKGEIVKTWKERDRLGRVYDESEAEREEPKNIILTISNSIQYKTEQALEAGVKAANAKSGMAVVLDPKTGEVLAMANYPTFDPNKFNEKSPETWKNRAVQEVFSPGSVFKAIGYGAALEEKLISPAGEIDGRKGFIQVGGRRFNDPHATAVMSYSKALAVSSNYAAIKTALGLGKDRFYNYARKFGFGQATGIDLPAEASGTLRSPETWNGDSLASMSIGYEVSVTALQSAAAYAAIANDGVKVQPHVIKEIRDSEGNILSQANPASEQVLSVDTAKQLREMLRGVVTGGTAKRAQLYGYSSAGKTGTAWKYDESIKGYNSAKYVSSFVGMAPVEDPRLVIAVIIDEPRGGARDGGQVSAPVFREIAEQVLPELNVVPDANILPESITAENLPQTVDGDAFEHDYVNNEPSNVQLKEDRTSDGTNAAPAAVTKTRENSVDKRIPVNEGTKKRSSPAGKDAGLPSKPKKKPEDERSKRKT